MKYHKVCESEWKSEHKDFKAIIKGKKYMVMWTNKGTALVPIKFKKNKC